MNDVARHDCCQAYKQRSEVPLLLHRLSIGLNTALRTVGLRIARRSSPTRTFADFFDHLKRLGFEAKTVVDLGVADGTPAIYAAFPDAKYYLIEPLEEFRPVLDRLKAKLDAQVVLAAGGDSNGEIHINVHDDLSGSSLFLQAEGSTLDGARRRVRVVRLDSILPASIARPALVKIDTQGAELAILEGLGARVDDIDMFIMETSLLAFRRDTPTLAEVVRNLDDRGFSVYDILEGHVRVLDGALAQVDLVFVPKDSLLRRDARFFSEDQTRRYLVRTRREPSVGRA
jgi:FkbM family methyltransferase